MTKKNALNVGLISLAGPTRFFAPINAGTPIITD